MKNITVSVDDEVYRQARIAAAERTTSVSALVAEFLGGLGGDAERFERLLNKERRLRRRVPAGFSASTRVGRGEVYQRG